MQVSRLSRSHHLFLRGFTLLEMLIVIVLITILLTIGSRGLWNLSKAKGVSAGLPVMEGLFEEARTLAMAKGVSTRVLIYADSSSSSPQKRQGFLRKIAIAAEELDADGNLTGEWAITSTLQTLPKGVFFSPALSQRRGAVLPTMTVAHFFDQSNVMCYYYEWNRAGYLASPEISETSMPACVIRSGALRPNDTEPQADASAQRNIAGFVIWKNGRFSRFKHPDQIDNP